MIANLRQGYAEGNWTWLSTDTKPDDVPENSIGLELDTGKFYYFSGGDWYEVGTSPS